MPSSGGLRLVEEDGVKVLEGTPGLPFMASPDDATRILEECFSTHVWTVILHAENVNAGFFDLSSGDAGAVLQRLRNYGVRLAVICPPGSVRFSTRFEEMLAEESKGRHFGVFENRPAALVWAATG